MYNAQGTLVSITHSPTGDKTEVVSARSMLHSAHTRLVVPDTKSAITPIWHFDTLTDALDIARENYRRDVFPEAVIDNPMDCEITPNLVETRLFIPSDASRLYYAVIFDLGLPLDDDVFNLTHPDHAAVLTWAGDPDFLQETFLKKVGLINSFERPEY